MADNNKENKMSIDYFDFAHEEASDDTPMLVNYLVTRLQQAMGNPALQGEVQQQLHAYGILPPPQQEGDPEKSHGETSKRGLSTAREVENPYQELKQLLEGKPSSKKKGHAQHERSPSREREESESQDESMEDVAPRRRRAQSSPTPTKRKRSPHSPHCRESKREEKSSRKKKERKRSPSSPSSPSSSSDEGSGYSSQEKQRRGHRRSYAAWKRSSKLKKFKEGGKNISFLTYDGTFGATDKVLAFIQQFDAVFGDEGFTESSKLRNVTMHFQKSAKQWWASLRANGEAPNTWKALRTSIMKQSLASDAKDKEVDAVSFDLSMSFTELLHSGQSKRVQATKDVYSIIEVPVLDEDASGTRKTNRKRKMTEKMRSLHELDHAHKREVSLNEKMTTKHDETVKNDNQFQDILDRDGESKTSQSTTFGNCPLVPEEEVEDVEVQFDPEEERVEVLKKTFDAGLTLSSLADVAIFCKQESPNTM
ncbi:hypothetical protein L7F22_032131 [Adiantum nelumboides]|nr:hypothetical protein [Adiantum nelumboides]